VGGGREFQKKKCEVCFGEAQEEIFRGGGKGKQKKGEIGQRGVPVITGKEKTALKDKRKKSLGFFRKRSKGKVFRRRGDRTFEPGTKGIALNGEGGSIHNEKLWGTKGLCGPKELRKSV